MSNTSVDILSTVQFPHIFSSSYNSKQRGVAILINRKVKFTVFSIVTDPEGRFIVVNLSVQNMKMCLANLYGPNVDDPSFFHSFFTSLSEHTDSVLIIGGDFNMVMDPTAVRLSNAGNYRNWQSANIAKQYMEDLGLCDVWHSYHPNLKEYTFFSSVHHSYSRLDYFLVSSSLVSELSDIQIHPITVSDHAPVSFNLRNKSITPPSRNWRFNLALLKDPDFISYFKREWSNYLENNDTPGVSAGILWEAGKAVMRGKIIYFASHKKKKENATMSELELRIKSLEDIYNTSPEEQTLKQIRKAKLELNEIINKKTQFMVQRLRLEQFEHSNKSGKLLANQLKTNKEKSTINSVKDSVGNIIHEPNAINDTFRNFYRTL